MCLSIKYEERRRAAGSIRLLPTLKKQREETQRNERNLVKDVNWLSKTLHLGYMMSNLNIQSHKANYVSQIN